MRRLLFEVVPWYDGHDSATPAAAVNRMTTTNRSTVTEEYRLLHKYLRDRYADKVVLTFAQIEDLLGFVLPNAARVEQGWWANPEGDSTPSPQSQCWMQANRTATARLLPQVVVFERTKA